MTTTDDQDKAIQAIMYRDGYARVDCYPINATEIGAIGWASEATRGLGHVIRDDGAELAFDGALLGYPAHDAS